MATDNPTSSNYFYDKSGQVVSFSADKVPDALAQGFVPLAPEVAHEFETGDKYGGVGYGLAATGLGAARGLTLGLSDVGLRTAGVPQEWLQGVQEAHPGPSIAGEAAGVVAPLLLTAGAAAPVEAGALGAVKGAARFTGPALAARVARGVEGAAIGGVEGASVLRQVGARAAGAAAEGALYGAGSALSEDMIGDPNLNAEQIFSHMAQGALFGGVAGGALGALEKATGFGLKYGGKKIAEGATAVRDLAVEHYPAIAERLGGEGAGATAKEFLENRGFLGNKQAVAQAVQDAADVEKANVVGKRASDKQAKAAAAAANTATKDEVKKNFMGAATKVTPDAANGVERIMSTMSRGFSKDVKAELNDALGKIWTKDGAIDVEHLLKTLVNTPEKLEAFANRVKEIAGSRANKTTVKTLTDSADNILKAVEYIKNAKKPAPTVAAPVGNFTPQALTPEQILARKFTATDAAARANTMAPTARTIFSGAGLGTLAHMAGVPGAAAVTKLGAAAAAATKATEFLGNPAAVTRTLSMIERVSKGTADAITAGMDKLAKGIPASSPGRGLVAGAVGDASVRRDFEKNSAIARQMAADPEHAADRIGEMYSSIGDHAPQTRMALSHLTAKATSYLASKLPQHAKEGPLGKDWQYSKQEMMIWERHFKAVTDPLSVIKMARNGTIMPEHAEAIATVYPGMRQQMLAAFYSSAAGKTLPYRSRLGASVLFGMDMDGSALPKAIMANQKAIAFPTMNGKVPGVDSTKGGSSAAKLTLPSRAQTTTQAIGAGKR